MRNVLRGLLTGAVLAVSFPASATFHLMNIREVYAGSRGNPASQYVMLQMRFNGQNQLSGHRIVTYNAAGTQIGSYPFTASVANGVNQRFVLIATAAAQTEFGIAPDLVMAPDLAASGGRVCFDNIDCVSWGNYSGSATSPSATGTPFNAALGISSGRAIRRDISGGSSATMLDATDDTGDSAADFDFAPASGPTNNAAQAYVPVVGSGFNFLNFADTSMLNLAGTGGNGPASVGGVLRLTPLQTGVTYDVHAWHRLYQSVASGFETRFQFRITVSTTGADGFAFVLGNESSTSLGAGAAQLGYGGITNNLAVEFDTAFSDAATIGQADPFPGGATASDQNHVSIHTQGLLPNLASEAASIAVSSPLRILDDGAIHSARIVYIPGSLQVYVDNMEVPVAQTVVTLPSLLDFYNGAAFVGFTATTPSAGENHDLLNWSFGPATPDTSPTPFTFPNITNAVAGKKAKSKARTVGGINTPAALSFSSTTSSARIFVNGIDVTASPGTVKAGDSLQIQLKAPASGQTSTATVTVGTYSTTWSVSTP